MDKASYHMLIILRNIWRVQEIRSSGIIRYAVSNWTGTVSHFSENMMAGNIKFQFI